MLSPVALDYIDFITPYLRYVKDWHLHFCIFPRTCFLTGKRIWLTDCYKGTRTIGLGAPPGSYIVEKYYIDKHEFMLWSLKI